jgi:hypothetical protein
MPVVKGGAKWRTPDGFTSYMCKLLVENRTDKVDLLAGSSAFDPGEIVNMLRDYSLFCDNIIFCVPIKDASMKRYDNKNKALCSDANKAITAAFKDVMGAKAVKSCSANKIKTHLKLGRIQQMKVSFNSTAKFDLAVLLQKLPQVVDILNLKGIVYSDIDVTVDLPGAPQELVEFVGSLVRNQLVSIAFEGQEAYANLNSKYSNNESFPPHTYIYDFTTKDSGNYSHTLRTVTPMKTQESGDSLVDVRHRNKGYSKVAQTLESKAVGKNGGSHFQHWLASPDSAVYRASRNPLIILLGYLRLELTFYDYVPLFKEVQRVMLAFLTDISTGLRVNSIANQWKAFTKDTITSSTFIIDLQTQRIRMVRWKNTITGKYNDFVASKRSIETVSQCSNMIQLSSFAVGPIDLYVITYGTTWTDKISATARANGITPETKTWEAIDLQKWKTTAESTGKVFPRALLGDPVDSNKHEGGTWAFEGIGVSVGSMQRIDVNKYTIITENGQVGVVNDSLLKRVSQDVTFTPADVGLVHTANCKPIVVTDKSHMRTCDYGMLVADGPRTLACYKRLAEILKPGDGKSKAVKQRGNTWTLASAICLSEAQLAYDVWTPPTRERVRRSINTLDIGKVYTIQNMKLNTLFREGVRVEEVSGIELAESPLEVYVMPTKDLDCIPDGQKTLTYLGRARKHPILCIGDTAYDPFGTTRTSQVPGKPTAFRNVPMNIGQDYRIQWWAEVMGKPSTTSLSPNIQLVAKLVNEDSETDSATERRVLLPPILRTALANLPAHHAFLIRKIDDTNQERYTTYVKPLRALVVCKEILQELIDKIVDESQEKRPYHMLTNVATDSCTNMSSKRPRYI